MPADLRAAVFDMDGVLVNNAPFHREAWRRLSREEGFPLTDPEFWRQAIGRPVEEAVPRILGRPIPVAEAIRLARRKTALYHELADGHAPPVPGVVEFVRGLATGTCRAPSRPPRSRRARRESWKGSASPPRFRSR